MKKSDEIREKVQWFESRIDEYFRTQYVSTGSWRDRLKDEEYKKLSRQKMELEQELKYWEAREPKAYCNRHGYTDVYPYEVVRVVSDKRVEVRAMKATQTKFPQQFTPGGFSGHYHDNRSGQDYKYESNPEAPVEVVRWSEANRQWQQGKYIRFVMSDRPYKFYDYNF